MPVGPDPLDVLHEPDAGARLDAVPEAVVGVARGALLLRRRVRRGRPAAASIANGYAGGGSVQIQSRTRFRPA